MRKCKHKKCKKLKIKTTLAGVDFGTKSVWSCEIKIEQASAPKVTNDDSK